MSRRNVLSIAVLTVFAGALPAQAQSINLQEGFAPLVERVMPSVVNIRLEGPRGRDIGAGSGFIIAPDGVIATNLHVIEGAMQNPLKVRVELDNDKHYYAKLVGYDPHTDISVIKIDAKGLRPVTWGDSSKVRRGEFALALGNPMGLAGTVSFGIVSAVGRRALGAYHYEDFIQTDAAVNPGNSGGPLVNARGEVIGINSIIKSPSGGSIGLGFAISSNLARSVIDQLARDGRVVRGFLGVQLEDIDEGPGALIRRVEAGTPAALAGLRLGDVLVSINGRSVYDSTEAKARIAEARPGSEINLAVVRNGARREVKAKLATLPDR